LKLEAKLRIKNLNHAINRDTEVYFMKKTKKGKILSLTEKFCTDYLDKNYKKLTAEIIEKITQKDKSLFHKGKPEIWAASIIHSAGTVNALFNKKSTPHIKYDLLVKHFSTSKSTVTKKSGLIKNLFKEEEFKEKFTLKKTRDFNPVEEMMDMFTDLLGLSINTEENLIEEEITEEENFFKEDCYLKKEAEEIYNRVYRWGTRFIKSPYYEKLTEEEKNLSESIIMTFTNFMNSHYGLRPEEWDEDALEECCLYTLTWYILAGENFFKAIVPVLTCFFTFLSKAELLENASRLIKKLKEIKKQLIKNAKDPNYWNPGKALFMEAQKHGVNIYDEEELGKFMLEYSFGKEALE
jgi:hypothetical protein